MFAPHPSLSHVSHRPYPLPQGNWAWRQTWRRLLFMHWPVPVDELRAKLPVGLEVDTFEGQAWAGVVPFKMSGIAHRPLPAVPGTSVFPELNLRTYVKPTAGGPGGVFFVSLDASKWLACRVARLMFNLPYFHATMTAEEVGDETRYDSRRRDDPRGIGTTVRYRPTAPPVLSTPGSLDAFLTERYCLYVPDKKGRATRADIHHEQLPLAPAEAEIERESLASGQGVTLPDTPPVLHYAEHLEVVVWPSRRIGTG